VSSAPEKGSAARSFFPLAIATVCGIGYVPVAPGTFGSAAGLLLWMVLPGSAFVQFATIVALFVLGSIAGNVAERHFGRTDPRQIIVDEVMGMLITLFLNPVSLRGAFVGFLLFRLTDVIKPYPANRLERLPGGVGVMADDAMAALYANLALRFCIWSSSYLVIDCFNDQMTRFPDDQIQGSFVMSKTATRSVELEPIDRLEEKVKRLVGMIDRLRADQAHAAEENQRLTRELAAAAARAAAGDGLVAELSSLKEERDVIRSRVTDMLDQLDALNL
jgi:phosphatidylglycerophosphatase A